MTDLREQGWTFIAATALQDAALADEFAAMWGAGALLGVWQTPALAPKIKLTPIAVIDIEQPLLAMDDHTYWLLQYKDSYSFLLQFQSRLFSLSKAQSQLCGGFVAHWLASEAASPGKALISQLQDMMQSLLVADDFVGWPSFDALADWLYQQACWSALARWFSCQPTQLRLHIDSNQNVSVSHSMMLSVHGSRVAVLTSSSPLVNPDPQRTSQIIDTLAVFISVVLKQQQQCDLAKIAQGTNNGVLITDPEGHIRWSNQAFTAMTA